VISHTTADFRSAFGRLPTRIQRQARKNYRLWLRDPQHPSLEFKLVGRRTASYSVRVSIGWRALGLKHGNEMIWFWIGSHADYDRLLKTI